MMGRGKIPIDYEDDEPKSGRESQDALLDGYRQMAGDREHELEAEEWTEQILFVPE